MYIWLVVSRQSPSVFEHTGVQATGFANGDTMEAETQKPCHGEGQRYKTVRFNQVNGIAEATAARFHSHPCYAKFCDAAAIRPGGYMHFDQISLSPCKQKQRCIFLVAF